MVKFFSSENHFSNVGLRNLYIGEQGEKSGSTKPNLSKINPNIL